MINCKSCWMPDANEEQQNKAGAACSNREGVRRRHSHDEVCLWALKVWWVGAGFQVCCHTNRVCVLWELLFLNSLFCQHFDDSAKRPEQRILHRYSERDFLQRVGSDESDMTRCHWVWRGGGGGRPHCTERILALCSNSTAHDKTACLLLHCGTPMSITKSVSSFFHLRKQTTRCISRAVCLY